MDKTNRHFGSYILVAKLSEGTSGVVYKAQIGERTVALKIMISKSIDQVRRFRLEAATLARIRHPNIVRIEDAGEHDGKCFIAMEYLDGLTLSRMLDEKKALSSQDSLEIVMAVADALGELHQFGFVHRDIKPTNIFLTNDKKIKLIDLGLAGEIDFIKSESAMVGTPLYCSPEQTRVVNLAVDGRSDLYSLGVTLFQMLTGRTPFIGSVSDLINLHISTIAPLVKLELPSCPVTVNEIVRKLLAKDPDDRYRTAFALAADLRNFDALEIQYSQGKTVVLGNSPEPSLRFRIPFIDRPTEFLILKKTFEELWNSKKSGLVLVTGSAGVGKTRLCAEFAASKYLAAGAQLRCFCEKSNSESAFTALASLINSILDRAILEFSTETLLIELSDGLEGSLLQLSPKLGKYLAKNQTELAKHTPEQSMQIFQNEIIEFFRRLALRSNGLVLFIDDIQWIDRSSLSVLKAALEKFDDGWLAILATKTQEEKAKSHTASDVVSLAATESIYLSNLDLEKLKKLIYHSLNSAVLSEEIVNNVFIRSEGNPLFAIEIIELYLRQDVLGFSNGSWYFHVEMSNQVSISGGLKALLESKLISCAPKVLSFVETASIFGSSFKTSDIRKINKFSDSELMEAITEASSKKIIVQVEEDVWKFCNGQMSEIAQNTMTPDRRLDLALAVGKYLQSLPQLTTEYQILAAKIFQECSDEHIHDQILSNYRAGVAAFTKSAHFEAFRFLNFAFEKAVSQNSKPNIFIDLANKLSISATFNLNYEVAISTSDYCIQSANNSTERARFYSTRLWILKTKGDFTLALQYYDLASREFQIFNPVHFQIKAILFIIFSVGAFIQELLESVPSFWRKKDKKSEENIGEITNMYLNAIYCFQYAAKGFDLALLSMRILYWGQMKGEPRMRAIGYACAGNMFALYGHDSLAKAFLHKAVKVAESVNDSFTVAICQARLIYATGINSLADGLMQYEKYKKFLESNLDPLENFRLSNFLYGPMSQQSGKNLVSLKRFEELYEGIESGAVLVNDYIHAITLSSLMVNLGIIRPSDTMFAKYQKRLLEISFRLIKNPAMSTFASNLYVILARYNNNIDLTTKEILNHGLLFSRWVDPARVYVDINFALLQIRQFEITTDFHERHSVQHRTLKQLRSLTSKLFYSHVKSNFYLCLGTYCRVTNRNWLKEFCFSIAESIATKNNDFRVLFEISKERARVIEKRNTSAVYNPSLLQAQFFANKNSWRSDADLLNKEFSMNSGLTGMTTGVLQNLTDAGSTIQAKAQSTIQSVHQSDFSTKYQADSITQNRYIQALLKINQAFTSASDLKSQSSAVLNQIVKLFAAERGYIFVKNEKTNSLEVLVSRSTGGVDNNELTGFSRTIVSKIVETNSSVYITCTDDAEAMGSQSAVLHNLKSIMAAPLVDKDGQLLGAVYLDSRLVKGLFKSNDVELFENLANNISVAMSLSKMNQVQLDKTKLQAAFEIEKTVANEGKKVQILLDNMQQAVFSVNSSGIVVDPVSKYSHRIFEKEITGESFKSVLFSDSAVSRELIDSVDSVMATVFGEDALQWDLMSSNIPKKITFKDAKSLARTLKVQTAPIWSDEENLERLLFVVEDITNLEALENQVKIQKEKTAIVEEVILNDPERMFNFEKEATSFIKQCKAVSLLEDNKKRLSMSRDLHTLKGNARLYKLSIFASVIHDAETAISSKGASDANYWNVVSTELERIETCFSNYQDILSKFTSLATSSLSRISPTAIANLTNAVAAIENKVESRNYNHIMQSIERLSYVSLRDCFEKLSPMVQELSQSLKKDVLFSILDDALVDPEILPKLQDCLVHVLRNSVDHGIESPQERIKTGKDSKGAITISCFSSHGNVSILIEDNGKGIDGKVIGDLAVKKGILSPTELGLLSDSEKVELIFSPNFSSKDEVTEISGRGIGMNVVKENIGSLGGAIKIETTAGKGSKFVISLPNKRSVFQRMA